MDDLVFMKRDEALTDTLIVAQSFGKRHDHVIEAVERLLVNLPKNRVVEIVPSYYTDAKGEKRKKYLLDRDAFSLLVMGFTGKKALEWKLKYIEAFNKMESAIREKTSQHWLDTRQAGKLTRREETDAIAQLVEYAKGQGSGHADMLYLTYSKLARAFAGTNERDGATAVQLNRLKMYEGIASRMIYQGMAEGRHYKEIYQKTKERFEQVRELAFLAAG